MGAIEKKKKTNTMTFDLPERESDSGERGSLTVGREGWMTVCVWGWRGGVGGGGGTGVGTHVLFGCSYIIIYGCVYMVFAKKKSLPSLLTRLRLVFILVALTFFLVCFLVFSGFSC